MVKMTLTEALATYKLTLKKIGDKTMEISHYTVRDERIVDPLLKDKTTSQAFVESGMQSIEDLSRYALRLKAAISEANRKTSINILGTPMSVEEAIVWRRDLAPLTLTLYRGILNQARSARLPVGKGEPTPIIVVNFNESLVMESYNKVESALSDMDTRLSIINATTMVEV